MVIRNFFWFFSLIFLLSSQLFAESKYNGKNPLLDKRWSYSVGWNLGWLASCEGNNILNKNKKYIKSLSEADYKNFIKGLVSRPNSTRTSGMQCGEVPKVKPSINLYINELTVSVDKYLSSNIVQSKSLKNCQKFIEPPSSARAQYIKILPCYGIRTKNALFKK